MAGYTKLSSSLVTSTVWRESSTTRCVWITMLALADQHGEVQGSVPGLGDMARVSIAECEEALQVFLSPDRHSRTKTHEGRRIEPIDGGWVILNYGKHRDLFSLEHRRALGRERVRRFREKAGVTESNAPVTAINDKQKQTAEAKANTETTLPTASAPSVDVARQLTAAANAVFDRRFSTNRNPVLAHTCAACVEVVQERGIPIDFAVAAVVEMAEKKADPAKSMAYFAPGLRERWAQHIARADAAATGITAPRPRRTKHDDTDAAIAEGVRRLNQAEVQYGQQ